VMLKAAVDGLQVKPDGIYVDGTLGRGGHSAAILAKLTTGRLYAFDLDETALVESRPRLAAVSDRFTLFHANFKDMRDVMGQADVTAVDGILLDLGVSSPQCADPARGFSYRAEARLDMRMDQSQPLDAYAIVNQWPAERLAAIFREYGEEPFAGPIARHIVSRRQQGPIVTTADLVEVIRQSLPDRVLSRKGHPAKQVFQALRIAVNDEMGNLGQALEQGLTLLAPSGRMAVISFQSLEDGMVKATFRKASQPPYIDRHIPLRQDEIPQPDFRLITAKPIMADSHEQEANHRSHSARLRIIERRDV